MTNLRVAGEIALNRGGGMSDKMTKVEGSIRESLDDIKRQFREIEIQTAKNDQRKADLFQRRDELLRLQDLAKREKEETVVFETCSHAPKFWFDAFGPGGELLGGVCGECNTFIPSEELTQ
jgi:hypothetical protein